MANDGMPTIEQHGTAMSDDTTEMYPDHDARYEKNVENLFSLWLQGLYVKRQVSENWEPIVSEIARKAQQEGIAKSDVRKLVRGQVLDLVGNAMQHPRYIQMAGTLEYGLANAVIFFYCKPGAPPAALRPPSRDNRRATSAARRLNRRLPPAGLAPPDRARRRTR